MALSYSNTGINFIWDVTEYNEPTILAFGWSLIYSVVKRKIILPCTIKSTFSNPLSRCFPEAKIESYSTATQALLLLYTTSKEGIFISPTTLSLGCQSWPEHEVRLSMCCN